MDHELTMLLAEFMGLSENTLPEDMEVILLSELQKPQPFRSYTDDPSVARSENSSFFSIAGRKQ